MRTLTARLLVYAALVLTALHHLDHLVRGNHLGWPVDEEINAFTFSLLAYPLIVGGLLLSRAGRAGPAYWMLVSDPGALLLAVVHLGPGAVEPPRDVIEPYDADVTGVFAFALLLLLMTTVAASFAYEARAWWQERRAADSSGPVRRP